MISSITGLENLTLLGGSAPGGSRAKYMISAVHFGKTKELVPRNFYDFDRNAFSSQVLPQFCRFLRETGGK